LILTCGTKSIEYEQTCSLLVIKSKGGGSLGSEVCFSQILAVILSSMSQCCHRRQFGSLLTRARCPAVPMEPKQESTGNVSMPISYSVATFSRIQG
jgi:hypothetical protein